MSLKQDRHRHRLTHKTHGRVFYLSNLEISRLPHRGTLDSAILFLEVQILLKVQAQLGPEFPNLVIKRIVSVVTIPFSLRCQVNRYGCEMEVRMQREIIRHTHTHSGDAATVLNTCRLLSTRILIM